jgi:pilus assembly protein TadC
MGATDIASVVGTWVAAFVAIIALVGIVGPFLILRASRTERNKAIAAIDDENHQFIGKGVWLLPKV